MFVCRALRIVPYKKLAENEREGGRGGEREYETPPTEVLKV